MLAEWVYYQYKGEAENIPQLCALVLWLQIYETVELIWEQGLNIFTYNNVILGALDCLINSSAHFWAPFVGFWTSDLRNDSVWDR